METTTLYNLDDIFYGITEQEISVWTVNNILTSAVGRKVIYELKNVQSKKIITIEEPKLQIEIEKKNIVVTLDELRAILKKRMDSIVSEVEETKKQFMKAKLKRTLNGNARKAENNLKDIRKKIQAPDNDTTPIEENEIENEIDIIVEESKEMAEKFEKANYIKSVIQKTNDENDAENYREYPFEI